MDSRLKYVVAVAKAGSFTAAADLAGVTQSAITKSIADLEQQIGYAIFYRSSRGSFLTTEGRDFVDRAVRVIEDVNDLMNLTPGRTDPYSGTLRIGVGPASLEWRLIAPIRLLLKRHPNIKFDVTGATFERTVELLRAGSIDVAIGLDAAFAEWADIRREPVTAVPSIHFVRHGHPLLDFPTVTFADLAGFDFVSPSEGRPYGTIIKKIYENQGADWRRRVHVVDYFPLVRQIVANSDAIGVAAAPYAQTLAFKARFAALEHLDALPPSPLCCALRKRWEPKPITRAFMKAVRETQDIVAH